MQKVQKTVVSNVSQQKPIFILFFRQIQKYLTSKIL